MKKVMTVVAMTALFITAAGAVENSVTDGNIVTGQSQDNSDAERLTRANERFKAQKIKWTLGEGKEPSAEQLKAACLDEDLKLLFKGGNIIIAREAFTNYLNVQITPYVNMGACMIVRDPIHLFAQDNDGAIPSPLRIIKVKK